MKLAKLSLAAMVVAGLASSSFAASDTLADAFKNGKVKGELKAWYFDKDTNTPATYVGTDGVTKTHDGSANITDFGIELGYITDSLYGFRLGATFQGVSTPFAADDAKVIFNDSQYTPGSVLSEAYLGYAIGKTDIKVGRQYISTPVVGGSASRIFRESFEGVTIVNTDLPQTTLVAGYVDKFQGRTGTLSGSSANSAPQFNKKGYFGGVPSSVSSTGYLTFDGAYTGLVINKSITNLTLTAQYAVANDVADLANASMYYTEANYVLPVAGFKLGFDVNYRGSKTGNALDGFDLEGTYLAARVSISELAGFGASFAAATTDSSDGVLFGFGNGPTSYTSTMIRGTSSRMTANTDSYLFAATYDFAKIGVTGLTAIAQYGWTTQDRYNSVATTADHKNAAAGVTYDVQAAALKGLTLGLQYETQEKETTTYSTNRAVSVDTDELWFKAGYKF